MLGVIILMGVAVAFLVVLLWAESLKTTELNMEVRMLRERYESKNTPDKKSNGCDT